MNPTSYDVPKRMAPSSHMAYSSHPPRNFDEGRLMICTIASAARRSAPTTISFGLFAATLILALGAVWSAPVMAQDTQSLINRIDRLERDIQSMSRQVYSGGAPKGGAVAPSGGGSVGRSLGKFLICDTPSASQAPD